MTRVLLIVVDGCTPRVLQPALDAGELPTLAALAARGTLRLDCTSIFPSITPAATAAIITGAYPSRSGIGGMSWWNPATEEISYLGDDVWTIAKRGFGDFIRGFLLRLNGERLTAPTLFQVVERHGGRAASFNYLIFKGDARHEISAPRMLQLFPSFEGGFSVSGPQLLSLGDFVAPFDDGRSSLMGRPFHRFGFDDETTAHRLARIRNAEDLPHFTVAYFPDYDFDSHERGPEAACPTLQRLDSKLAELFDTWGGIDRVLETVTVVLTADHSHSVIGAAPDAGIELEVLDEYRRGNLEHGWRDGDEILVCPNMRAAEVYIRDASRIAPRQLASRLVSDRRVDQVVWCARTNEGSSVEVLTADRGALRFWKASDNRGVPDAHGRWELQGELGAVDAHMAGGHIEYGAYPNALERLLQGVDHDRAGRLWVTARPGYEFRLAGQSVHQRAGSHGTLHEAESLVPLLVAGRAARHVMVPEHSRIVDVAPICARVLGYPLS